MLLLWIPPILTARESAPFTKGDNCLTLNYTKISFLPLVKGDVRRTEGIPCGAATFLPDRVAAQYCSLRQRRDSPIKKAVV